MSTQGGRIRNRRWNQATGPISATICSVLEAGWKPSTRGFWQAPDTSATLDGALFNNAQIIDSFSKDGWALAQLGHGEGHHHRFCQESQVSTDQRGKFHGCTCAGLSRLWNLICLRMDLFPTNFSVFVATREPCHQVARIVGMSWKQTDQSRTHERIRPLCDTGAEVLGQIKFCLLVVSNRAIGYQRASSENARRSECGKAAVSKCVPVTTY